MSRSTDRAEAEGPSLEVVDVATSEPDLATEVLGRSFPGIEFGRDGDSGAFRFAHRRVSDGYLAVNRLTLTGRARSGGEFPSVVASGQVRYGRYSVDYGRRSLDTTAPFLRPGGRQLTRFEDTSVDLITLDPVRFEQDATLRLAGTGSTLLPISPAVAAPVSPEAALLWRSMMHHIIASAADPDTFSIPLIRAALVDLSVTTMLTVFPLTEPSGSAAGHGAHPAAIRRAIRYMEEHLADPITAPMIAEAARLSVRGLQHNFETRLRTTPMRYLRDLRLRAARDELLRADRADGDTVASIARRWGFTHLSRFSADYRSAFGELPVESFRH